MYEVKNDLVHRYVQFIFYVYSLDPYGWITKDPPTLEEFDAFEFIEGPWENGKPV